MHYNNQNSTNAVPDTAISESIISGIESITTDPIARSLEKRQPKKYPMVWITSRARPVVTIYDDIDEVGAICLFTTMELAQEWRLDVAINRNWPLEDFEIRKFTLVEALTIAREQPVPLDLLSDLGVCTKITGVCIEGVKHEWFYPV